jgi:hypothetical protein
MGSPGQFKIEEIRAVKACVTSEGFAYLDGLTDLKKIHLEKCDQISDSMSILFNLYLSDAFHLGSIARCNKVKETLESVALIDLVQISENGLAYLAGLRYVNHLNKIHFS